MTKKGAVKLMAVLQAAYPRHFTVQNVEISSMLWQEMLDDIPDKAAFSITKKLISTGTFPPSIAEIRKEYAKTTASSLQLDADIEWAKVESIVSAGMNAMRSNPRIFDTLSNETRNICQVITWWSLCNSPQPDTQRRYFYELFGRMQDKEMVATITRKYDALMQSDFDMLAVNDGYHD